MIAVGIDIAKAKIDIWYNKELKTISNTSTAIYEHFKVLAGLEDVRIVMESTGRYHRLCHKILSHLGLPVMVINPYQSRHFAKGMHILCKTDKVDAKVLSLFAEKMNFKGTPVLSDREEQIQNLIRHLDDLKKLLQSLRLRLNESKGFERDFLERVMAAVKEEIKEVEKRLQGLTNEEVDLKWKKDILMSIPGIGESAAIVLLGFMRELGEVSRGALSALGGLAPMNWESGTMKGRRRIQRGRRDVRAHLYMPILGSVTKHNAVLKAFYQRL